MRKIIQLPLNQAVQDYLDNRINQGGGYPPSENKSIIRKKLLESQKYLCCYCECVINEKKVHIEHFFEQSDYGILHNKHSLDYLNNMMVSCEGDKEKVKKNETKEERKKRIKNTSCGHKKGKSFHGNIAVDYDLLLNPYDDIEHLFLYSQGYISASKICTEIEKTKVAYTIKRLALDAPKLNRRRKMVIEELEKEIINRESVGEDITSFLFDYLDDTSERLKPYFSTLKENFSYLLTA
jgi:uncharacterized protein (TIGR02646 family)